MKTITFVEAQNRFGELLDNAQPEPVTITRRGRPVAFVVSPEDMKDLLDTRRQREQALTDFMDFFARADARISPAAKNLNDTDIQTLVNELR